MLTATASPRTLTVLKQVCSLLGLSLNSFLLYDHPMHAQQYNFQLNFDPPEVGLSSNPQDITLALQALHVDPLDSDDINYPVPPYFPYHGINHILTPRILMFQQMLGLLRLVQQEYSAIHHNPPSNDTAIAFLLNSLSKPTADRHHPGLCFEFTHRPSLFLHLQSPRIDPRHWNPANRIFLLPFQVSSKPTTSAYDYTHCLYLRTDAPPLTELPPILIQALAPFSLLPDRFQHLC